VLLEVQEEILMWKNKGVNVIRGLCPIKVASSRVSKRVALFFFLFLPGSGIGAGFSHGVSISKKRALKEHADEMG
jgi:hypothetical protein